MLGMILLVLSAMLSAERQSQQTPQASDQPAKHETTTHRQEANAQPQTPPRAKTANDHLNGDDESQQFGTPTYQTQREKSDLTWTAAATLATAIATLVLAYAAFRQLSFLRKYVADTRTVAEAAKKSAGLAESALHDLERPRIVVVPTETKGIEGFQGAGGVELALGYAIRNDGRTLAWITRSSLKLCVIKRPWPSSPPYDRSDGGMLAPVGPGSAIHETRVCYLDPEEAQQILYAAADVLFFGFVDYLDTFRTEHTTRFVFRLDTITAVFWPPGDKRSEWESRGEEEWTSYT